MDIRDLVQQLRQPGARVGVGVWLLPDKYAEQEASIASVAGKLNLHPLDARQAYLDYLPAGARFSGLTRPDGHHHLLNLLRTLTGNTHPRNCLLVHVLDLLLLGLEVDERERFWHGALETIPYPHTKLILTVPEHATELFPFDLTYRYPTQIARGKL